jgi:hypothetical protein
MKIEEMGYVKEMRQRLGLEPEDIELDGYIESLSPMERVRLIAGWYQGDEKWADAYKEYFESQGIYLTTDANATGIIWDEY